MTIYARQIAPEYQESPLFIDETFFPDDIAVFGNRHYKEHMPEVFRRVRDTLDAGELAEMLEDIEAGRADPVYQYETAEEAIRDMLPPEAGREYSPRDVDALKTAVTDYAEARRGTEETSALLRALAVVTGKEWDMRTIRGCCQGDWQEVYFPVDAWSREALDAFEIEYFNTGSEWIIHDETEAPESPEDIIGFSVYCHSWNNDGIRAEIAAAADGKAEEVKLFEFSGYTKNAHYVEVK